VANITETCHPENPFQLVVKVQTESNNTDDATMLAEALPSLKERTDVDEMDTNGGYNSPEVDDVMREHQVQQIQTAIRGRKPSDEKLSLENFEWQTDADAGQPQSVACPHGQQAEVTSGRKVDAIDVVAEEEIAQSADALDSLKAALQEEVGASLDVLYPAARAETITEAMQGISLGLSFFAVTALFGGAYLIFNTFSMTVVERTREIGMLRAIGATKGQNVRLILVKAFALGLAGSLIGLVFGLLLAVPMAKIVSSSFGLGEIAFAVSAGGFIAGFIVGIVVTAGSALIPAIRAGRITPIEALAVRGKEQRSGWLIRHGWKVGLALVVLAESLSFIPVPDEAAAMGIGQMSFLMLLAGVTLLVPLITGFLERLTRPAMTAAYGNEGQIGTRNVSRVLGRTTITVGALTMGILMFVVLGSQTASMMSDVRDWMNAALRGDLFVSSFRPMRLRLEEDLATVEGVNLVTPMRFHDVKVVGATTSEGFTARDEDIAFIAVDPLEYTQISEFEFASGQGDGQAMLDRLMEGTAVFISTSMPRGTGSRRATLSACARPGAIRISPSPG
jgi:putative ABC transport system permease protein